MHPVEFLLFGEQALPKNVLYRTCRTPACLQIQPHGYDQGVSAQRDQQLSMSHSLLLPPNSLAGDSISIFPCLTEKKGSPFYVDRL